MFTTVAVALLILVSGWPSASVPFDFVASIPEDSSTYLKQTPVKAAINDVLNDLTSQQPKDIFAGVQGALRKHWQQTSDTAPKEPPPPKCSDVKAATAIGVDVQGIAKAVHAVTTGKVETSEVVPLKPHEPTKPTPNQFVMFIKPEATSLQNEVDVCGILSVISELLHKNHITVGAQKVLGGNFLRNHHLIEEHYGVISNISRLGIDGIPSPSLQESLRRIERGEADGHNTPDVPINLVRSMQNTTILGGHQFLARYPVDWSPISLQVLHTNVGAQKIASGIYALPVTLETGRKVTVLNAFHPNQLTPFYDSRNAIIVLECTTSELNWSHIRRDLCGVTNPKKASKGSIRHTLLEKKESLGMKAVDSGNNGVHFSAGPVEGMVELCRFFAPTTRSECYQNSVLGEALTSTESVNAEHLNWLATNPPVGPDAVPVFDYSEEMDASELIPHLYEMLSMQSDDL